MSIKPQRSPFKMQGSLAQALDRVVIDADFRQRLDKRPVEALGEIGVTMSSAAKAKLVGKRLAEMLPAGLGRPGGEVAHPGVLVVVGVAIGTNLKTDELRDRDVYRKAIRARVEELTGGL